MNTKKRAGNFISLYVYKLKYLFLPGMLFTFISVLMTLYIYWGFKNKDSYIGVSFFLKNIPPFFIFAIMVPVLTVIAFKYMFDAAEIDFTNSLSFTKRQMFFSNILSVLTYTIVPLFAVYLQRFGKNYQFENYVKSTFSSKAMLGYLLCCMLAMSCIIIGLCLSHNLYIGGLLGYALLFIPRVILLFIAEIIQEKCPYFPTSELPGIFNSKLNIATNRLLNDFLNVNDLGKYNPTKSLIYTGSLALIYLIISYLLFKIKKSQLQSSIINLIKPGHVENRIKYIKKLFYILASILLLSFCIFISIRITCKRIDQNGTSSNQIKYLQIKLIGSVSGLDDLNSNNYYSDQKNYIDYCIQQQKFDDPEIINLMNSYYKDTIKNKKDFIHNQPLAAYCKVYFHTSHGTYVRFIRFSNNEKYNEFLAHIYKMIDLKKSMCNLPSFSQNTSVNKLGMYYELSKPSTEIVYNMYKNELQEMSEDELNNAFKVGYSNSTSNNILASLDLAFTDSKSMRYNISIELSNRFPKTFNTFCKEYIQQNKDSFKNLLLSCKADPYSFASLYQVKFFDLQGMTFYEQEELAYFSDTLTQQQMDKISSLMDIALNNINNINDVNINYTYVTLQTDATKLIVPLNLNDSTTKELLASLKQK